MTHWDDLVKSSQVNSSKKKVKVSQASNMSNEANRLASLITDQLNRVSCPNPQEFQAKIEALS